MTPNSPPLPLRTQRERRHPALLPCIVAVGMVLGLLGVGLLYTTSARGGRVVLQTIPVAYAEPRALQGLTMQGADLPDLAAQPGLDLTDTPLPPVPLPPLAAVSDRRPATQPLPNFGPYASARELEHDLDLELNLVDLGTFQHVWEAAVLIPDPAPLPRLEVPAPARLPQLPDTAVSHPEPGRVQGWLDRLASTWASTPLGDAVSAWAPQATYDPADVASAQTRPSALPEPVLGERPELRTQPPDILHRPDGLGIDRQTRDDIARIVGERQATQEANPLYDASGFRSTWGAFRVDPPDHDPAAAQTALLQQNAQNQPVLQQQAPAVCSWLPTLPMCNP